MSTEEASAVLPAWRENGVNPEKLYTLWSLVTQHHLSDEARIEAILQKTCSLLGVDIALVGEIVDGQYCIRHACDAEKRFVAGMQFPLAATPARAWPNAVPRYSAPNSPPTRTWPG